MPGRPRRRIDIAFPRRRLAVFIDGCFWHGCPAHFVPPKSNAQWWAAKIESNRARDRDTDIVLQEAGWTVVRCWEHAAPSEAAAQIAATLGIVRGGSTTRDVGRA